MGARRGGPADLVARPHLRRRRPGHRRPAATPSRQIDPDAAQEETDRMTDRRTPLTADLTRRRFLQGSALAGTAAFLAACGTAGAEQRRRPRRRRPPANRPRGAARAPAPAPAPTPGDRAASSGSPTGSATSTSTDDGTSVPDAREVQGRDRDHGRVRGGASTTTRRSSRATSRPRSRPASRPSGTSSS